MKKLHAALIVSALIVLASCEKEHSLENGGFDSSNIVGQNCRMSRIGYVDSATGVGVGAVIATINSGDSLNEVMDYDSANNSINFLSSPVYVVDTIYIDADEYFIQSGVAKVVSKFHGLLDTQNPASPAIDVTYNYNAAGYLVQKQYFFSAFPGIAYQQVDYTYSGGNMVGMQHTNLVTGDLISDATVTYGLIAPKNFLYIFPDELTYQDFTQFLNFGAKNTTAVSGMTVNTYDPGMVLTSTSLSVFSNYILSADQYVLSCQMTGTDQPSIPALAGKLTFGYHCK